MSPSPALARRMALLVVVLAAGALAGGAGVLDQLSAWAGNPVTCAFRARHGLDCVGCGGTRAFGDVSRGRVRAGFTRNPIGAMAAGAAWAAFAAGVVALKRGRVAPMGWTLAAAAALLALTFVWHLVRWWHALPPGLDLR